MFKKGVSGNPKGRTKSYKKVETLRQLIAKDAAPIVQKLIAQALAGDVMAARLLIERAVPVMKPVEVPVELPMPKDAGLTEQGRSVISAMADGMIAPGQASAILQGLGALARLIEITEFEKRLAALEAIGPGEHGVGPDWRGLVRPAVVYRNESGEELPD